MEDSTRGSASTPPLLKVVGWVTVISGALQVLAGILVLAFRGDVLDAVPEYTSTEITGFAIATIVVGSIYFLVGRGYLHLNAFALWLGLAVSSLGVIGDVILLFANDSNHSSVVISLVLNLIVLVAVSSGFSARRAAG